MNPMIDEENTPFNFDQYLAEEDIESPSGSSGTIFDVAEKQLENKKYSFNFDQYLADKPDSKFKEPLRHAARIGSRAAETVVGMPGDFVNFVKWIDSKVPKLPDWIKNEPSWLQKKGRELVENLPTSQSLKEKMSELTEGYTDPQSSGEQFGDDIIGLATALTIGKDPTKVKNLLGSLGKAVLAKSSGKGVELLGGAESAQAATELGTLFLTGLWNRPMADKYVANKYQKARASIPEKTMIDTSNLANDLSSLEADLSKGLSTATKNEVLSATRELKNKAMAGHMPMSEVLDSYHDINERMSSKKLFDELSTGERKKLKFRYDKLKTDVNNQIKEYGKYNPEFLSEWQEANQAYKTIEDSKRVSNFLSKNKQTLGKGLGGSVAYQLLFHEPSIALATVGAAGTSYGAVKIGELMYRISKSPTLRKHYMDVIKHSTAENLPATIKSLKLLDKEIEKDQPSSPKM